MFVGSYLMGKIVKKTLQILNLVFLFVDFINRLS